MIGLNNTTTEHWSASPTLNKGIAKLNKKLNFLLLPSRTLRVPSYSSIYQKIRKKIIACKYSDYPPKPLWLAIRQINHRPSKNGKRKQLETSRFCFFFVKYCESPEHSWFSTRYSCLMLHEIWSKKQIFGKVWPAPHPCKQKCKTQENVSAFYLFSAQKEDRTSSQSGKSNGFGFDVQRTTRTCNVQFCICHQAIF